MDSGFGLVMAASMGWGALFYVFSALISLNLPKKDLWDLRNRVVSAIHGVYCLVLSTIAITHQRSMGDPNNEFESQVLSVSLGYFLYDTICMYKYDLYDSFIIIHHSLCLLGMSCTLIAGVGSVDIMYGLFITEISNPCMHIREVLKLANQRGTKTYLIFELSFFGFYFFGRLIIGIPIVYSIVTSWRTHIIQRLMTFSLEVQSFIWAYQMIGISRKRYSEYLDRKLNQVELPWFNSLKSD
mmetsp:Transcript_11790/g.17244  ORF Transcript_11790/g.17244 Transcript_11790/m.17244 type:complete len:241 (-) Transcript_11790:1336-2058(-)